MTLPLRILLAFEDRAFEDIVLPVIERVFTEDGRPLPRLEGPLLTHGCHWKALKKILRDYEAGVDLVLVGADTGQATPSQKRKAMAGHVETVLPAERVVYALPQPSAEGWMQADLNALKLGVQKQLEISITLPDDTGAYPLKEAVAKSRLASILSRSGVSMLSGGREYGPAVMQYAEFSSHPSLESFVRDLRRWLLARA